MAARVSTKRLAGLALGLALVGGCSDRAETTFPSLVVVPVIVIQSDPVLFILRTPIGGCEVRADIDFVEPDLALADRLIDAASGQPGMLAMPRLAFFGPLAAAGAALGGSQVVVGPRETWMRTTGSATQLIPHVTPRGRTVWMTGSVDRPVACGAGGS